jgi:hypothetical protein
VGAGFLMVRPGFSRRSGQVWLICTADEPKLPAIALSGKITAPKGDSHARVIR